MFFDATQEVTTLPSVISLGMIIDYKKCFALVSSVAYAGVWTLAHSHDLSGLVHSRQYHQVQQVHQQDQIIFPAAIQQKIICQEEDRSIVFLQLVTCTSSCHLQSGDQIVVCFVVISRSTSNFISVTVKLKFMYCIVLYCIYLH